MYRSYSTGRQPLVIEPSAARTAAAASSVVLQLQMRTSQTGHQVLTAIPVRRTKPAEQLPFRAVDANHSRSARVRGSCGSTSLGSSSLVQQSAVETSLSVEEEEEEGGRPRSCSCQSIGIKGAICKCDVFLRNIYFYFISFPLSLTLYLPRVWPFLFIAFFSLGIDSRIAWKISLGRASSVHSFPTFGDR